MQEGAIASSCFASANGGDGVEGVIPLSHDFSGFQPFSTLIWRLDWRPFRISCLFQNVKRLLIVTFFGKYVIGIVS